MPKIEDLAKDYNEFKKPLIMIKVNDAEIDKETLLINHVVCELTAGYEASYCSMEIEAINNKYEEKKGLILNDKIDAFKLGLKVEVLMGYNDETKLKTVFIGYVTQIELNYDNRERVIYKIECMDLKVFMMHVRHSKSLNAVKNYSDAVVSILNKYSSFCDGFTVESTKDGEITHIEQFNESDYEFIVKIAKKINYLFFIINNKVIFKERSSLTGNCLTVSPGPYLMNFKRKLDLTEQIKKVKVVNNDESDPNKSIEGLSQDIVAIGKGSKGVTDLSNVISEDTEQVIIDHEVNSVASANRRANAELGALSMRFVTGEFELVGIPDAVPGQFITMELLEDNLNNDYFITQVTHEYSDSKYATFCKFSVNKI